MLIIREGKNVIGLPLPNETRLVLSDAQTKQKGEVF